MEIVIDIPEKIYKAIQDNTYCGISNSDMYDAIRNGTPLPKGHGALKDTDTICKDVISALGIRNENYLLEAEKAIYKKIKNAPTIIEADKEDAKDADSN